MNKMIWISLGAVALLIVGVFAYIDIREAHKIGAKTVIDLQQKEVVIDSSLVPNSILPKPDPEKSEPIFIRVRSAGEISLDGAGFKVTELKEKLTNEDRTRVIKIIMEVDDFQIFTRILVDLKKLGFNRISFENKNGA